MSVHGFNSGSVAGESVLACRWGGKRESPPVFREAPPMATATAMNYKRKVKGKLKRPSVRDFAGYLRTERREKEKKELAANCILHPVQWEGRKERRLSPGSGGERRPLRNLS